MNNLLGWLENKHKELRIEWRKDLKDITKQINDSVNEKLNTIKHEQDSKIQDVHDLLQATTSKTSEIETRTMVIENKLEETSKTAKDYSGEMSNMKEEVKIEMDQLRAELRRRPAQMTMYPAPVEERVKLTFAGNKWENSMEFLTLSLIHI